MTNLKRLGAAVAALALLSTAAAAQNDLVGITALNDRLDDIETKVADDQARANDDFRFGNPDIRDGLSGSASLSYTGTKGNTDTQDFSLGTRLRYASGPWVQTIGMAIDFSEAAGVKSKQDVFGVYDVNYYINDKFYGFILGRVQNDGLAATAAETQTDAFLGAGPGYRFINTESMAWRVQAGIGASYLKDGVGTDVTEVGYLASSRFYYKVNDTVSLSNDTDILSSDTALRINNDMGVSFKVTNAVSTRISYLSEYNDSRAIKTDNTVGLSLVFGF